LLKFDFLVDMVSWDKPGERFRFTILYSFLSTSWNSRFYILCQTREGVPLESIIDLYESSSWLERECWDMHGIYFVNHNNFLRLLTDYGFRGHPLRKDFPLSGFVELFYDDSASGVVYEPVELVQEYRNFQFKSPWAEDIVVSSNQDDLENDDFDFDFDFDSLEQEPKINNDDNNIKSTN
jgi:NADH-quinone oxidoreductase subunit C